MEEYDCQRCMEDNYPRGCTRGDCDEKYLIVYDVPRNEQLTAKKTNWSIPEPYDVWRDDRICGLGDD